MGSFVFEGRSISTEDGDSVLSALLRSGVDIKSGCKAGACQSCLLRSSGTVPETAQSGLEDNLIEIGAFLSCQAQASEFEFVERLGDGAVPTYQAELVRMEKASEDVLIADFVAIGFEATAGRFIQLGHSSGVTRPYSIATPANEARSLVRLHIRLIPGGKMSDLVLNANEGDVFSVQGPFGKCRYKTETGEEPIVMIGSGTGLAPLYAIASEATARGHRGPICLYHGAANSDRLYFRRELKELSECNPMFCYTPCVDADPTEGDKVGSPLAIALGNHPNLDGYRVFLCGHPDLVKLGKRKCFLAGANLRDIAADPFEPA